MLVWEGGNLEENMDSMREILAQGLLDAIVFDTIHAFASKADTEAAGGVDRPMTKEPTRAPSAKSLSRFFRVTTGAVADAELACLLIGQARAGEYAEELVGGEALKHYNSLTVHFVRINNRQKIPMVAVPGIKDKQPAGFIMKATVDKTRINHLETRYIEVPFLFGLGPDVFEANVMAAVKLGVIQQAGSYYTLPTSNGDEKLQGKPRLLEWVRKNERYYEWLMQVVTGGHSEPENLKPEDASS